MSVPRSALPLALLLLGVPVARAAWSDDPALNFAVADAASDQAQVKLAPTWDGHTWVSWFDGIGTGYDVRLQLLDRDGNEVFAHGGLLVANRGFSSTQDYGLDTVIGSEALLAFRDDRTGSVQITAARVWTDGTMPWGPNGVQLTATTDFVAAPKITGTPDNGCIVAWTQNSSVKLQKLDANGVPQWTPEVTYTPATGSYSVSDLHETPSGTILSFVHQTGGFGSPRRLLAQKLDGAGAPLWGASHVAVFDTGSLQFGNFPYFVPDASGGAVFSWYDASTTALQCYAQRILSNGTEAFAHNGVAVSANGTRVRVSPSAAFDSATGSTLVFWQEQNSLQSQSGVYGQRLDASGNRLWGTDGVAVVPLFPVSTPMVRTTAFGAGGAFVYWSAAPSFGTDVLYGARLDGSGVVDIPPFFVCSVPATKSRLAAALFGPGTGVPRGGSGDAYAVLAWGDGRNDDGDIYVQNVNSDGSLGPPVTGAPEIAAGAGARLGPPRPNPTAGDVQFEVSLPRAGAASLVVRDVAGRLVRTLTTAAQDGAWRWDGRDDSGGAVASGVYFVELRSTDGVLAQRVARIR